MYFRILQGDCAITDARSGVTLLSSESIHDQVLCVHFTGDMAIVKEICQKKVSKCWGESICIEEKKEEAVSMASKRSKERNMKNEN